MTSLVCFLITLYQRLLSPALGHRCRFYPSCSSYTQEALKCHGLWKGLFLGAARILRCHPWGGEGFDPVPQTFSSSQKKVKES